MNELSLKDGSERYGACDDAASLRSPRGRRRGSPLTGDPCSIGLCAAVAAVCLAGIVTAVVLIKKKGGKK